MKKLAIKLGKLGSAIGILAGIIEISIGTKILPWIGNKEDPALLGIITLFLSTIALISIRSINSNIHLTNDRKLARFFGIFIPTAICFTTVGRLWYLPGTLLIVTCLILGYDYWFNNQSKDFFSKGVLRELGVNQITSGISSIIILALIVLSFSHSAFGLYESKFIANSEQFRFEVIPMDIVRFTKISGGTTMVENIEVRFIMVVYILLILGAFITLLSSLVKSRIFTVVGVLLVFAGLGSFFFWLPTILSQTNLPVMRFQDIVRSLGIGWYISLVGMSSIMITSLKNVK